MRKVLLALTALALTVSSNAKSINITVNQLPAPAKAYVIENFGTSSVRKVEKDSKEYEVKFYNGTEIEFYKSGDLKKVESDNHRALPTGVLNPLPASVKAYVNSKFAGWKITEVKVKDSKIEIELEKGRYDAELKFTRSGKLLKVEIDD